MARFKKVVAFNEDEMNALKTIGAVKLRNALVKSLDDEIVELTQACWEIAQNRQAELGELKMLATQIKRIREQSHMNPDSESNENLDTLNQIERIISDALKLENDEGTVCIAENGEGPEENEDAGKPASPPISAAPAPMGESVSVGEASTEKVTSERKESLHPSSTLQEVSENHASNTTREIQRLLRSMKPKKQAKPTSIRFSLFVKALLDAQIIKIAKRYPNTLRPSQSNLTNAGTFYYLTSLEDAYTAGDYEEYERLLSFWLRTNYHLNF